MMGLEDYVERIFVVGSKRARFMESKTGKDLNGYGLQFEYFYNKNENSCSSTTEWLFYQSRPLCTPFEMVNGRKAIETREGWEYLKTMSALLTHCLQTKDQLFLVLTDGCRLSPNFVLRCRSLLSSLPKDWKVIQLGTYQETWTGEESFPVYRPSIFNTRGSFATAYHRSILPRILEEVEEMESDYDCLPLGRIYEKFGRKCFAVHPNLVLPGKSAGDPARLLPQQPSKNHSDKLQIKLI